MILWFVFLMISGMIISLSRKLLLQKNYDEQAPEYMDQELPSSAMELRFPLGFQLHIWA